MTTGKISGRQLIFMIPTQEKPEEQVAHEAWQAILKWREARSQQDIGP